MRDHAFDPVIIHVGRGIGIGQNVTGIEDVEALVLHCPHVEIADRDDVEQVKVIFAPEHLLIPLHRILERLHRMVGAVLIAFTHPDVEIDRPARHRGECAVVGDQIARHQGEQIARLGPGIVPFGPVRPIRTIAGGRTVTVRQQHRECRLRALHPDLVDRKHIGPIREERDPPEPFSLALGAEHPVRGIEPHQLGVGLGIDLGGDRNLMAFTRKIDQQVCTLHPPGIVGLTIDQHRLGRNPIAFQPKRLTLPVAFDLDRA